MHKYQFQSKGGQGEPKRRPPSERGEVATNSKVPAFPEAVHHPGHGDDDDEEGGECDDGGNGSEEDKIGSWWFHHSL